MTDTPTTDALIAAAQALVDKLNQSTACDLARGKCGVVNFGDELSALVAAIPRAGASGEREARMIDALQSIREHCAIQPSALAKAIVATCDAALTRSEADEAPTNFGQPDTRT